MVDQERLIRREVVIGIYRIVVALGLLTPARIKSETRSNNWSRMVWSGSNLDKTTWLRRLAFPEASPSQISLSIAL